MNTLGKCLSLVVVDNLRAWDAMPYDGTIGEVWLTIDDILWVELSSCFRSMRNIGVINP